jgi:hypothetical protein
MPSIITNLETTRSVWHPSGFMIFTLGKHPELGFLRLHVWPDLLRQAAPKGDKIHDHSWPIASLAVAGTYIDEIYDISDTTHVPVDKDAPDGLLRLYTAPYRPNGSQILHTDGRCVQAVPIERRTVPHSEFHTIEPGVFHRPEISVGDFAATLVLAHSVRNRMVRTFYLTAS